MNVCLFMSSGNTLGGAEEAFFQIVDNLAETGIKNLTIVFHEPGEIVEIMRARGMAVELIASGRLRDLATLARCVWRTYRFLAAGSFDVVVSWMTKAHIYAGWPAKWCGLPAIYFQHGNPDGGIVDRLCRSVPAANVIACSEFVARQQRQVVGFPVVTVHPGVNETKFDPERVLSVERVRVALGLPLDRPIVGMVARLQHWKGVHVFIEALALVRGLGQDCVGVVVGGPEDSEPQYEASLRGLIVRHGLQDSVVMAGKRRNVEEWLQAMDVFVHASNKEPFGIVVVEAMAMGKPVIATVPGGPSEILADEKEGLLVPFGDSAALAKAMRNFLTDRELALTCSQSAKVKARDFSALGFARRFGGALRSAIDL